jgi:hypothetical protein
MIENSFTLIQGAMKRLLKESNINRITTFSNFHAFFDEDYEDMWDIIKKDLKERKLFSESTLNKIQFQHMDIIHKALSRLAAGIYDRDPVITLNGEDNEILNEILESLNYRQKVIEALHKSLFVNTTLSNPVYRDGSIEIDVLMPDEFSVIPKKNYLLIDSVVISRTDLRTNEQYGVYWSDIENYIIDAHYNNRSIGENTNNVNPFGVIPVSVLRIKEGIDFYGEPNWNLYSGQTAIDTNLTNLHFTELFNYFPIRIGVNLGLKDDDSLAPNKMINVELKTGQEPPSLNMVRPDVDWAELRENIEWRYKMTLLAAGIPASSASIDQSAQSGVAKEIDEIELVEKRLKLKNILYYFEIDLLEKIRTVWNYYASEMNEKQIPDGDFNLSFAEDDMKLSTDEKIKRDEFDLKHNLTNPLRLLSEKLEIDETEAEEMLKDNIERNQNKAITDTNSIIDRILTST